MERGELTLRLQSNRKTCRMNFSELTLPQKVAAHELSLRAVQDETRALRALVVALIGIVASPVGSAEYEASLAVLNSERNRS